MATISIDALPLLGQGGISNYVRPLVSEMLRLAVPSWQVELVFRLGLFRSRANFYQNYLKQCSYQNVLLRPVALPDRFLSRLWRNGLVCGTFSARGVGDVFLATTEMIPKCKSSVVGVILYDLTPVILSQFFNLDPVDYLCDLRGRLKYVDFLVAISKRTKNDIVELLGFAADRIVVVYPGVSPVRQGSERSARPERRPYILYLGALARNKNVDGLLRIFARCVHTHGVEYDLVLAGKDFCGPGFWSEMIKDLGIQHRVCITGWVTDLHRRELLSHAAMLWQFSWYEGFGLPVLEAAAQGIPVLYTNRGAVPEILVNPEQEIDPAEEEEAAARAARALSSPGLLCQWAERGKEVASKFSWEKSATRLLNWIESAI